MLIWKIKTEDNNKSQIEILLPKLLPMVANSRRYNPALLTVQDASLANMVSGVLMLKSIDPLAGLVQIRVESSEHAEIVKSPSQTLNIAEGREQSTAFSVRVKDKLGSGTITFIAGFGGKETQAAQAAACTSFERANRHVANRTSWRSRGKGILAQPRSETLQPICDALAISSRNCPSSASSRHGMR
jgi:hypothetical protein